jgi:hypothetical protein
MEKESFASDPPVRASVEATVLAIVELGLAYALLFSLWQTRYLPAWPLWVVLVVGLLVSQWRWQRRRPHETQSPGQRVNKSLQRRVLAVVAVWSLVVVALATVDTQAMRYLHGNGVALSIGLFLVGTTVVLAVHLGSRREHRE